MTVATLLLGALASVAAALLVPEIARHVWDSHAGLWRGVFGHKNIMGRMMSFAVVADAAHHELRLRTAHGRGRLLGAPLIRDARLGHGRRHYAPFPDDSAGLQLVLAVRTAPYVVVPAALGAGLLLALTLIALAVSILSLLGRDLTLSGRTPLWELALGEDLRRPLLGPGFRTS